MLKTKKCLLFSFFLITFSNIILLQAQTIYFKYDESGNRIKRTMDVMTPEQAVITLISSINGEANFTVSGIGKGRVVFLRKNEQPLLPINGNEYVSNLAFGSINSIVSLASYPNTNHTYCVYKTTTKGTEQFTISNLENGATYTISVFEYCYDINNMPNSMTYNTEMSSLNSITFTEIQVLKAVSDEIPNESKTSETFYCSDPFPNPASANTMLDIHANDAGDYKIDLINESGQSIQSHIVKLNKGANKLNIDLNSSGKHISSGAYFLKISFENECLIKKLLIIN